MTDTDPAIILAAVFAACSPDGSAANQDNPELESILAAVPTANVDDLYSMQDAGHIKIMRTAIGTHIAITDPGIREHIRRQAPGDDALDLSERLESDFEATLHIIERIREEIAQNAADHQARQHHLNEELAAARQDLAVIRAKREAYPAPLAV